MSYKLEDPDGEVSYFDENGNDVTNMVKPINDITVPEKYWELYSRKQFKRHKRVMRQLMDVWYDVFCSVKFCSTQLTMEETNNIMKRISNFFLVTYRRKIEYYNEEKIIKRSQKGYIQKKINKLKNKINSV